MTISKTEKIWNVVSMLVFVLLLIVLGILLKAEGTEITDIRLLDLLLICIATYRMTRLLVYDRIFKLVRDIIRSFEGTGIGDSDKGNRYLPLVCRSMDSSFQCGHFLSCPFRGTVHICDGNSRYLNNLSA
jgi:hypothetical protein